MRIKSNRRSFSIWLPKTTQRLDHFDPVFAKSTPRILAETSGML